MLIPRCVYILIQEMLLSRKASHIESGTMKRAISEENSKAKRVFFKQESINFGYDVSSYANYSSSSSSSTSSTITQALPGQPPLPPMPPSSSGVPPPPHVFGPVPSQMTPIQWTHAHTPWQWITPQTSPLPTPRHDIASTIPRDIPLRGNYVRRERFTHNRNSMYIQRNNFHRKNRRIVQFGQPQGQFDQTAYFGATLTGNLGLQWQRNIYNAAANDNIRSHMTVPLSSHSISPIPSGIMSNRHNEETEDQDVKIEKVVKKNKQRKPMSQSYVNKPWNREDAERALRIESEYNMKNKVNAQSLIIKFPDTDLNKDIVSKFHSDILNIHFQNPCGPRYCSIQMAEDVNIDEAIKELEKIKFGVGYLKVEKKILRDEDNPEEIDPYTLFIGNLPESVKTSEIKSKFPKAQDEETRKMKNTRNILMRYNSVDDAISDYKQAYGLIWDKRNINVRFRRKRGNTCLPEEPKPDVKKVKEEPNNATQVEKERNMNYIEFDINVNDLKEEQSNIDETQEDKINRPNKSSANQNMSVENGLQDNSNKAQKKPASQVQENISSHLSELTPSDIDMSATMAQEEQRQSLTSQSLQILLASEAPPSCLIETDAIEETMLTQIKEEPVDYDEMDIDNMQSDNVDDDADDDDDEDDDDDDDIEEPDDTDDDEDNNAGDFENDDEDIDDDENIASRTKLSETQDNEEPSDHLDQMFSELGNMTGDIGFLKQ
ncbi:PREDICTED: protein PFC0760c-like isoform X1 [Acromyrmex echinatior]|uniref:protein PFC0760c-like isoform X1 n=1 Tax=Acromyrmex echinatior TaxID=103372 RepID=UPI000580D105|nr:PREDICTED: protein PFC0760c-like isoform X1 [Acromyrmex echinatior]